VSAKSAVKQSYSDVDLQTPLAKYRRLHHMTWKKLAAQLGWTIHKTRLVALGGKIPLEIERRYLSEKTLGAVNFDEWDSVVSYLSRHGVLSPKGGERNKAALSRSGSGRPKASGFSLVLYKDQMANLRKRATSEGITLSAYLRIVVDTHLGILPTAPAFVAKPSSVEISSEEAPPPEDSSVAEESDEEPIYDEAWLAKITREEEAAFGISESEFEKLVEERRVSAQKSES
tara:strand:- start:6089 stop:6778 length:690 start_codon:yes stop_codon:yes gene_type:complete